MSDVPPVRPATVTDWITAQLAFTAISFCFGVPLLFAANQGRSYALYDSMRHYAPIWVWGLAGVSVAVVHVTGYVRRHRVLVTFALAASFAFWLFISLCAFLVDPTLPACWACLPHVAVFGYSAVRVPYWTRA